jgi:phosphatidylserine/phosphatidylglycerophosphate/cardiolipin synthase-like enzyme
MTQVRICVTSCEALLGSTNVESRSVGLNDEINVAIVDRLSRHASAKTSSVTSSDFTASQRPGELQCANTSVMVGEQQDSVQRPAPTARTDVLVDAHDHGETRRQCRWPVASFSSRDSSARSSLTQ